MENITAKFESLPMWAKVVLLLIAGTIISPVYRILRYFETKNTTTLIVGIIAIAVGCGGTVLGILDALSEFQNGKITLFAE